MLIILFWQTAGITCDINMDKTHLSLYSTTMPTEPRMVYSLSVCSEVHGRFQCGWRVNFNNTRTKENWWLTNICLGQCYFSLKTAYFNMSDLECPFLSVKESINMCHLFIIRWYPIGVRCTDCNVSGGEHSSTVIVFCSIDIKYQYCFLYLHRE